LPALVLLRKPLFGLAKRQLPRTLSAIGFELVGKYIKINIEKNRNIKYMDIGFLLILHWNLPPIKG